MFILSSISISLEFSSINHTSIYENSESKVFKNIKVFVKMSNSWSNNLLEINTLKNSWMVLLMIVDNITMD